MEPYYEVEDFELGNCAMCKKSLDIAGIPNPHIAICLDCEQMIRAYDPELGLEIVS